MPGCCAESTIRLRLLPSRRDLHHAADLLAKASDSTAIAGQLKKLGKYGSRLTQTGQRAFGLLDEGLRRVFADLERRLSALQLAMERGVLARLTEEERLAVRADAVRALGQLEARSTEFLSRLRSEAAISQMVVGSRRSRTPFRAHLALLRATAEAHRRITVEVARQLARLANAETDKGRR